MRKFCKRRNPFNVSCQNTQLHFLEAIQKGWLSPFHYYGVYDDTDYTQLQVDTLLFVRPTESLKVFSQQVGRGLRLHDRKKACTIIDLIGNYRNADIKLSLFDTESEEKGSRATVVPSVPSSKLSGTAFKRQSG